MLHELMLGPRTTGNTVERRAAARYQLRAPVVFRSLDDKTAPPGAGFVQDASTEGVFVFCPRPRSVGEIMNLEVLLPPFGTYDAKLVARYTGLVVRVEDQGGFAVAAKVSLHRYITSVPPPIPDEECQ